MVAMVVKVSKVHEEKEEEPDPPRPSASARWAQYRNRGSPAILLRPTPLSRALMSPMQRVYLFFGLRQGTMLIALHDMLWCSFLVFLFGLGTAHAREVSNMVEADTDENSRNFRDDLSMMPDDLIRLLQNRLFHGHDNDAKLNKALHTATVVTLTMLCGITMAAIDMVASMMLFAGATLRVRQLMMPWLSLRLMEMVVLAATLIFVLVYFARGVLFFKLLIMGCLLIAVFFYHWLVAYSLHEHLCVTERLAMAGMSTSGSGSGLTHHTSPAMGPTVSYPIYPTPNSSFDPMLSPTVTFHRDRMHLPPRLVDAYADLMGKSLSDLIKHRYGVQENYKWMEQEKYTYKTSAPRKEAPAEPEPTPKPEQEQEKEVDPNQPYDYTIDLGQDEQLLRM